ncbi:hypothetical protein CAOG_06167 [Capsaspora owczarzaki ATCC 30864]|uniref:Uncharacterized protein n=1 Tax=Capsaspora owczarzaki (strain ATCC 30864) TaxID=595528 RepID=A0A0D2VW59_CAPO3|nr:hypothetical protein CAOG_06167 [Capsaspora owczarzaki ATCC 30864]KJE95752.1 hypothetical protein CAOG_006167 [Capsaspora owczarzaki ATCC 30864]|eukprot:XP_004345757.1 hypothetical protein CAOG_06167 [Capsaspora owczarzaki ATCC 30864]
MGSGFNKTARNLRVAAFVIGLIGGIAAIVGYAGLVNSDSAAMKAGLPYKQLAWGPAAIYAVHLVSLIALFKHWPILNNVHTILIAVTFVYLATNQLTTYLLTYCNEYPELQLKMTGLDGDCGNVKTQFGGLILIIASQILFLLGAAANENGYTSI